MNVLILEDDSGSREILQRHLSDRGIDVVVHQEIRPALRGLEAGDVDVVLTDIHLPGARGTDHIRDFCAHDSAPLVVVMTGFPSLETCLDSFHFGAQGYLVKPFRVAEFIRIAEEGLARKAQAAELERLRARISELEAQVSASPGKGRQPE